MEIQRRLTDRLKPIQSLSNIEMQKLTAKDKPVGMISSIRSVTARYPEVLESVSLFQRSAYAVRNHHIDFPNQVT